MAIGVIASLVDEDFDVQLLSTESGEHGGWSEPEDTADHGRLSSIWLGIGLPVVPSVFYKPMCNDVIRWVLQLLVGHMPGPSDVGHKDPKRLDRAAPRTRAVVGRT